jgi:hypothetical protein
MLQPLSTKYFEDIGFYRHQLTINKKQLIAITSVEGSLDEIPLDQNLIITGLNWPKSKNLSQHNPY